MYELVEIRRAHNLSKAVALNRALEIAARLTAQYGGQYEIVSEKNLIRFTHEHLRGVFAASDREIVIRVQPLTHLASTFVSIAKDLVNEELDRQLAK